MDVTNATFTTQAGVSALIIMVIQWLKKSPRFNFIREDSSNFIKRTLLVIGSAIGAVGLSAHYDQRVGRLWIEGFLPGVPLYAAILALLWKIWCSVAVTHGFYHGVVKNDIGEKIIEQVVKALKS